jgi:hypothetical protein
MEAPGRLDEESTESSDSTTVTVGVRSTRVRMSQVMAGLIVAGCISAAFILRSPILLSLSTVILGIGFVWRSARRRDITIITFYAAGATLLFGVGDFVGYLVPADSNYSALFTKYFVADYAFEVQLIGLLCLLVPIMVFSIADRGSLLRMVPPMGRAVSPQIAINVAWLLFSLAWLQRTTGVGVGFLGAANSVVLLGPSLAIFIMRSVSLAHRSRRITVAIGLVLASEFVFQALSGFMRVELLWPLVAFAAPVFIFSWPTRRQTTFLIGLAVLFSFLFAPLGALRGESSGTDRVGGVFEELSSQTGFFDGQVALIARLSSRSQLSQIVRLTNEEGYEDGSTLAGLLVAPIPRFVWPSKPTFIPGQYFAARIGRGQYTSSGSFSNAINMTVGGEFFLNFGWLGLVGGLVLHGLLLALAWAAIGRMRNPLNPVALAFGFLGLTQAVFVGSSAASLMALVQLVVYGYVAGFALELLLPAWQRRRPA